MLRATCLRALVVDGASEEAVAVATEFIDGLLEKRDWAVRLVKVAAKLYSPTATQDKAPENWMVWRQTFFATLLSFMQGMPNLCA